MNDELKAELKVLNDKLMALLIRGQKLNLKSTAQKEQLTEEVCRTREKIREVERKEVQQFRDNLVKELMNEYHFNRATAEIVVSKGWEDGHSYGYNEVRTQSQIAADFAEQIIAINKKGE